MVDSADVGGRAERMEDEGMLSLACAASRLQRHFFPSFFLFTPAVLSFFLCPCGPVEANKRRRDAAASMRSCGFSRRERSRSAQDTSPGRGRDPSSSSAEETSAQPRRKGGRELRGNSSTVRQFVRKIDASSCTHARGRNPSSFPRPWRVPVGCMRSQWAFTLPFRLVLFGSFGRPRRAVRGRGRFPGGLFCA